MSDNHNSAGGVPTTGHVWDDDLADFTNQPPKWWMLGLTASAIWVVVYFLMYPAIPLATIRYLLQGRRLAWFWSVDCYQGTGGRPEGIG